MFAYNILVSILFSVDLASTINHYEGCWPSNKIPYEILNGFSEDEVHRIQADMNRFRAASCIRWIDVTDVDVKPEQMVTIEKNHERCFVNKTYNILGDILRAVVTLSDECLKPKYGVVKMLMFVLGFTHEHRRSDRDCYVTVDVEGENWPFYAVKPQPAWLERFPYDKKSVTHLLRTTHLKSLSDFWEPLGSVNGELSLYDTWKLRYRYCKGRHFCDLHPATCSDVERFKKTTSLNLRNCLASRSGK